MTADLIPPSPFSAIGAEDVARVERWAARQRAELSQLALALRSAQRRAERAERETPPAVEVPAELLAALDAMLETAARQADLGIQAARRDATATVAAGREQAVGLLQAVELDPVDVLGPSDWTSTAIPEVARPATATSLWQLVATGPVEEPLVVEPVEPPDLDEVELFEGAELIDDVEVVLDDAELIRTILGGGPDRLAVRAVGAAALGRPPPFDVHAGLARMRRPNDDGSLFEDFWSEAGVDVFWGEAESSRRPLRDRLRRRTPEGQW